jgi:hypothetical protein
MKIRVIAHKAEEGRFWAEVPSIPGRACPCRSTNRFSKWMIGLSNSLCDTSFRQATRNVGPIPWLDSVSGQWQTRHLFKRQGATLV